MRMLERSRGGTPRRIFTAEERLAFEVKEIGAGVLVALLTGVVVLGLTQGPGYWEIPVLISLGLFLAGALIGFLFGIPKVASDTAADADEKNIAGTTRRRTLRVNTNLEQISDWLTKIIVGVGLVDLYKLPEATARFTSGVKPAFHSWPETAPLAVAVYFPVLGFISGYLITRLYLSDLMGRADNQLDADRETAKEVISLVTDATQKSAAYSGGDTSDKAAAVREAKEAVRQVVTSEALPSYRSGSVLWVDDRPENNASLIDALRALGISVDLSLSTEEAIRKIEAGQQYDAIITDMGRPGDSRAGYTLLQELKNRAISTPVLIYAGSDSESHRREAIAAGAINSTNRPQEVFTFATRSVRNRHF